MNQNLYCNPVSFADGKRHTNPDPFVMRWCGSYYCYATDEWGVKVSRSEDLIHWEGLGYAIKEPGYHHYWAPSVLYRNGVFYMYYSNIPIEEGDCHQQHLKVAVSVSPEGEFQWKKTFFDDFSIDSHPVMWNGKQYLFYSVNNWIGTQDKVAGTCILVDEMITPLEFAGNPKPVVMPSLKQEIYAANRFGDGRDWYTIEGACMVVRGDRSWMLYSANAYENVDYFVGTAVADNLQDLLDMKWEKFPNDTTWMPLIKKNDLVEGTGHNTVAKAPNLVDDWIVYHGRSALEELKPGTEQREMRVDPLWYSGRQMFCEGPTAREQEGPAQPQVRLEERVYRAEADLCSCPEYYHAELWISGKKDHVGVRYGIELAHADEENYLELQVITGSRQVQVWQCMDGIRVVLKEERLPKDYDYTVPHRFYIQRIKEDFQILVDEEKSLEFTALGDLRGGVIGIRPYFSELKVHSFVLTEHACLSGKDLHRLRDFYKISPGQAGDKGLQAQKGALTLQGKDGNVAYREEFLLRPQGDRNRVIFRREGREILLTQGEGELFSITHTVGNEEERFLSGTKRLSVENTGRGDWSYELANLVLEEYRYTKM